ncbi:3-deoxy-D-manno-octulosonate 8-phosphate phosphatase KdsC [Rosistilla ulvae]|uniref:3-deoxy-D-manno-octulosonate 8-phosphate phosphatase KdsC n=1 Tax=Rosistilla ulvae TaxID=1930277 RepID=A0A517LYM7_9BACT|nr:HAD hydrolase family protein [Rosistilla ulvae]QDS87725.1 3-deoxy-D-manno-octulosonate 8-phosphate phosphatase KdsC [Rosistilla ulvae]
MKSDSEIAAPIKLILSDVDGVLTNGQIIYDAAGFETKAFHVRDGLGIKLWQRAGFSFGIITARNSEIVTRRAEELGITFLRQGCQQKWDAAVELMQEAGCGPEQTAYIGDDLPDLAVMTRVALPVCVSDAASDVRKAATWITKLPGGTGAVREMIERLLHAKSKWDSLVVQR